MYPFPCLCLGGSLHVTLCQMGPIFVRLYDIYFELCPNVQWMSGESEQHDRDRNKCKQRHVICHPSFSHSTGKASFVVFWPKKWSIGSRSNCSHSSRSCSHIVRILSLISDTVRNFDWAYNSKLAIGGCVSQPDLGPPFRTDDQRFYHVLLLDYYPFFFLLPLHIPSASTSPLSPFDSSSLSLSFHDTLFSVFLPPTRSLFLSTSNFSFSHFLRLSLYLPFCLSQWEFGKCSVSLMKEKCCFTSPALFWFGIKRNVKQPPYTHTDIHSIYPLLHPLSVLKIEAMQQHEGAEKKRKRQRGRQKERANQSRVLGKVRKNEMCERRNKLVWWH